MLFTVRMITKHLVQSMRSKQQATKLDGEEGQIIVMSFDTTNAGLNRYIKRQDHTGYRV